MELVLVAVLVALAALLMVSFLLLYQLITQNGRILIRLEFLEQLLAPLTQSDADFGVEEYVGTLQPGGPAPPIRLPDLGGVERTLSEWRGSRVLLVFFDPRCVFSQKLLPSLVALASDVVPGRPVPVVITTGTRADNLALFDEAGFSSQVLLQAAMEVAAAYKVDGTPMSYLIGADGTIASNVAVGIQSTLILAGEIATVTDATATYRADHTGPSIEAGLEATVTLRDGLKAGATAPIFRLPRVDGGQLSLLDYRGRDVVVVFSDPECGPCDVLAPLIEAAHRDMPALALVMISRGEAETTRAKAAEFGLSFPVALQRHWEISREYGIFATPAAFYIDEWGVIAADVALGNDSIMELIEAAAKSPSR